jgi:hypothetical protein
MCFHWVGRLPISYPELEDLKTEVSFNGSYAGERYQILLINKLLADRALQAPARDNQEPRYHHIDLVEIEMEKQRGFFDYVFEEIDVFDDALRKSLASFRAHEDKHAERPG